MCATRESTVARIAFTIPFTQKVMSVRDEDDRRPLDCAPSASPGPLQPTALYRAIPAIFIDYPDSLKHGDDSLRERADGAYEPALLPLTGDSARPFCDDEVFADQPRGAWCGAALVARSPDEATRLTILSAAHCIDRAELDKHRVVFDFQVSARDPAAPRSIAAASVCVPANDPRIEVIGKTILFDVTCPADFDAPAPLRIAADDPAVGAKVHAVGYPLRLPALHFGPEKIREYRSDESYRYFTADFDFSPGNSGSPVLDDQGRIVGITEADASLTDCTDPTMGCRRWLACPGRCASDVKISPTTPIHKAMKSRTH